MSSLGCLFKSVEKKKTTPGDGNIGGFDWRRGLEKWLVDRYIFFKIKLLRRREYIRATEIDPSPTMPKKCLEAGTTREYRAVSLYSYLNRPLRKVTLLLVGTRPLRSGFLLSLHILFVLGVTALFHSCSLPPIHPRRHSFKTVL